MIDVTKIDNVNIEGVDYKDAPDFCDAYIASADYEGREMTEGELEDLNANYGGFVYEKVLDYIY